MTITKSSDFGDNNIFLRNNGLDGERGCYINVDCDNPNGVDVEGNAKAIKIDLEQREEPEGYDGYDTNKRIVAKYGNTVTMPENAQELFVLEKTPSKKMVYTTNVANKYVWLIKKFDITINAKLDNNEYTGLEGASATLYDKDGSELETAFLDDQGIVKFTKDNGYLDGEYSFKITKDDLVFSDSVAVNSNIKFLY